MGPMKSESDPTNRVLLVVGPESSATRLFADVLSAHPNVKGVGDAASTHADLFDAVWQALRGKSPDEARDAIPPARTGEVLLTRRSMPHGPEPGGSARYLEFEPFGDFVDLMRSASLEPVFLVTTRSPAANLVSWTLRRDSSDGDFSRARRQYQESYGRLFETIHGKGVPFLLLGYEAFLLERGAYVQSLFQLLGLPPADVDFPLETGRNSDAYAWLREKGLSLFD